MKCQNCGNDYEGAACPTCGVPNPAMGQSNGSYTPPTNTPPANQGSVSQPPYAPYPDMAQSNGAYTPPMNQAPMGQPPYAPYPGMPPKKPVFKQWWFWVLIAVGVIVVISIISIAINSGKNATQSTIQTTSSQNSSQGSSSKATSTKNTFGVGETATTKSGVSITMTDVTESSGGKYFKPDAGQVWVIAHFTIENNSSASVNMSSYLDFVSYIDNTKVTLDIMADTSVSGATSIDGSVAPGKKMTGTLCYSAPKDYKTLEITYDPSITKDANNPLTFTYSK